MTLGNPCISTQWGCIDAETISELRRTLEDSGEEKRSKAVLLWRGQEVLVSFGWYLVEYVEVELAKRNTGGL